MVTVGKPAPSLPPRPKAEHPVCRGDTVPCKGHSIVWLRSKEGCVEKPARKLMLLMPVILTEWRPLL